MKKNSDFIKKLFFPLICLISMTGIASKLAAETGQMMQNFMSIEGKNIPVKTLWELGSIFFFAAAIFTFRNINPLKIFRYSLAAIAISILSSVFIFPNTATSCLLLTFVSPKLLSFLGCAYINQIATLLEGRKYFFALICIASLFSSLSAILPTILLLKTGSAHMIIPYLVTITLLALCLTWLCDRWISSRFNDEELENTPVSVSKTWIPTLLLAFIASGILIVTNLYQPAIKMFVKNQFTSPQLYANGMAKILFQSGFTGIIISILISFWIGPRILARKGWTFTAILAPFVGIAITLCLMLLPTPIGIPAWRALTGALASEWIFPLLQIAFLYYPKKTRFFMQAWVSLIFLPLIIQGTKWVVSLEGLFNPVIGTLPISIASFVVFSLMMVCILKLKNVINIDPYEQEQRT